MHRPLLRARSITHGELVDIARCFRDDDEWRREYTEDETIDLLGDNLLGLAVEVPADRAPATVYCLYLDGCGAPLFVQVREGGDRGLYEAGDGKLLRPRTRVPVASGRRKN